MQSQHLVKLAENAPGLTYTGAAGTLVFWGLHISDIAAILSTLCAMAGVGLQFYIALHRIRRLEKQAEANKIVTGAMSDAQRVVADKVDDLEKKS